MNFTGLNDIQIKAAKDIDGAIVVSAGAGSGKTTVLTNRIAYMIEEKGIHPYHVLAITFTNKASAEMRDRVKKLVTHPVDVWISTFHSMCVRILREQGDRLENRDKSFSIYDDSDSGKLITKILKERNLDLDKYKNQILFFLSDMKNKGVSISYYFDNLYFGIEKDLLSSLVICYEDEMMKNNALDFDDLLIKTYELLLNNPDIREKYADRFRYILVDEFQDTNIIQYKLVKILASKHRNIFIVGDEDQCIYTWRGAEPTNMANFQKDYEDVKIYKLEQNYRSTKKILELANKVIKNNVERIEKTLWTDNDEGVKVEYFNAYNDNDEAENVARQIFNLVRNSGYEYNDIAVLVRVNSLNSTFESALNKYQIPYKIFKGIKFYSRSEIKNIIAYLNLFTNPKDNESFKRMISFPKKGIGEVALKSLAELNENNSLMENLLTLDENSSLSASMKAKFLALKAKFIESGKKLKNLSLTDFVKSLYEDFSLLTLYEEKGEEYNSKKENLKEFISTVKRFESSSKEKTLSSLLQTISLYTDIDDLDTRENSVNIATIHAVKGLEFKVVFLVGLEEKRFPLIREDESNESMEEERRLMYVAITRAEERLYLSHASSRYIYGKTEYTKMSRFLKEMEIVKPRETTTFRSYIPTKTERPLTTATEFLIKNSKPTKNDFSVNDSVLHTTFGIGKVISVENKNVKINFTQGGVKTLNVDFAPLKKI